MTQNQAHSYTACYSVGAVLLGVGQLAADQQTPANLTWNVSIIFARQDLLHLCILSKTAEVGLHLTRTVTVSKILDSLTRQSCLYFHPWSAPNQRVTVMSRCLTAVTPCSCHSLSVYCGTFDNLPVIFSTFIWSWQDALPVSTLSSSCQETCAAVEPYYRRKLATLVLMLQYLSPYTYK